MMRSHRPALHTFVAVCASALLAWPAASAAQPPAGRRQARPTQQPGQPAEALAQQFRERLAEIVRRRLDLDDAQMRRLGEVNTRFERQRMQLLRDERMVRQQLRREMLAGESTDQQHVAALLDEALRIQRRRLDLTEQEQRALSEFMTPLQRAQYFGIQDELRRRMEDMRQRRPGAPGAGGRRPPL